jgi:hypothetical protein
MSEVSTLRLYLLRAMYVFMFVGLAIVKWPAIFNPPPGLSNSGSVVGSVLLAISLLAVLGIRYPIKMLPLLFFEFLCQSRPLRLSKTTLGYLRQVRGEIPRPVVSGSAV